MGVTPVALRAPSVSPHGPLHYHTCLNVIGVIILHALTPTRPTLIFQGVGVSLTLAQRGYTKSKDFNLLSTSDVKDFGCGSIG